MDIFEQYIQDVKNSRNADDICAAICKLGLFRDSRGIYNDLEKYQVDGGGGVWQNPLELATYLWETRDDLKAAGVSSFLDIGTFNGYTFFAVLEFLKAHVSPNIRAASVDPYDEIKDPAIIPYVAAHLVRGTVESAPEGPWDLVFVDGLHETPGPRADFDAVRDRAMFVGFHDISDRHCPFVVETYASLCREFPGRHKEFVCNPGIFGIGLLKLH
jgi:hypothetical protein